MGGTGQGCRDPIRPQNNPPPIQPQPFYDDTKLSASAWAQVIETRLHRNKGMKISNLQDTVELESLLNALKTSHHLNIECFKHLHIKNSNLKDE